MLRSTSNSQHPRKWAAALRREMQTAIGRQLRVEPGGCPVKRRPNLRRF